MKTQEILKRLGELCGEAGERNYDRISLADKLLQDKLWLATEHNGDAFRAAAIMERQFFHDLCGVLGLFDLLNILRKYPDKSKWKEFGYNLGKMHASLKAKPERRDPPRRATVEQVEKLEADNDNLRSTVQHKERQLAQVEKRFQETESEVTKLRRKVQELERENARLVGRIEELEKVLDRIAPAVSAA